MHRYKSVTFFLLWFNMAAICDILNARRGWIWKIVLLIDLKDIKGWIMDEKYRQAFI